MFASLVELAMVGYRMRNEGNQTIKIKDLGKRKKVRLENIESRPSLVKSIC